MKQQDNEAPTAFGHRVEAQCDLLTGLFDIQDVMDVFITGLSNDRQAHVRVLHDQFPDRTLPETVSTAHMYWDGTNKLRLQLKMTISARGPQWILVAAAGSVGDHRRLNIAPEALSKHTLVTVGRRVARSRTKTLPFLDGNRSGVVDSRASVAELNRRGPASAVGRTPLLVRVPLLPTSRPSAHPAPWLPMGCSLSEGVETRWPISRGLTAPASELRRRPLGVTSRRKLKRTRAARGCPAQGRCGGPATTLALDPLVHSRRAHLQVSATTTGARWVACQRSELPRHFPSWPVRTCRPYPFCAVTLLRRVEGARPRGGSSRAPHRNSDNASLGKGGLMR